MNMKPFNEIKTGIILKCYEKTLSVSEHMKSVTLDQKSNFDTFIYNPFSFALIMTTDSKNFLKIYKLVIVIHLIGNAHLNAQNLIKIV